MMHRLIIKVLVGGVAIVPLLVGQFGPQTLAQVTPDTTLPIPSNVPENCNVCTINGGTVRGTNLFHSFREFSVPTGGQAIFNNGLQIETILGRVTGESISNIDGLIRANGTANLFLLNPNGIILGPSAQLEIGGSFLATTADAIEFDDQRIFSATNPGDFPLLTVSMPVGLAYWTDTPQPITSAATVAVDPSQSLILAGGDIALTEGQLSAVGGRVELGGLAGLGTLGLAIDNEEIRLTFPSQVDRGNVSMNNDARVDVTADNGGDIVVSGHDVSLIGVRTGLLAGIDFFSGTSDSQAGDIVIDATGRVTLDQGKLFNEILQGATGNGGNITIMGQELHLINGGQLVATSFSAGNTGKITLDIQNLILVSGVGRDSNGVPLPSGFNSVVRQGGVGESGGVDITVRNGSLIINDGASNSATVVGDGIAGDINIQVSDAVIVDGVNELGFPSAIGSTLQVGARGRGGNLTIIAETVAIRNGANISVATAGFGDAGTLTIDAQDIVLDGSDTFIKDFPGDNERVGGILADVQRSTLFPNAPPAEGQGGDITLISDTLTIMDGAIVRASTAGIGDAGRITVQTNDLMIQGESAGGAPSGIFSAVNDTGRGEGGSIRVITDSLQILDGGTISVDSRGEGEGGDIQVTANTAILKDGSEISAATNGNTGGNINLQIEDFLLLRNGSLMSTNAGIEDGIGDGGNISINAPEGFIIAISEENSDITANAFQGRGGNVDITAQNIFGIRPRPRRTPLSDITASSEFGISGTIEINNLSVEPEQGVTSLPAGLLDSSQLIAQGCDPTAIAAQGEFYTSGRGGITPLGSNVLSDAEVLDDLRFPYPWTESTAITEAESWFVNDTGDVILTTSPPGLSHSNCWRQK
ncbi:filamentous hemagglutinin N-terminal domain-containing protein [Leptothoe sp. ISB3NOV94-8A]|nr:filamentous hemagglutinin N-terminal domain-containing protein [Leptothoe sp. LEGE 181152]